MQDQAAQPLSHLLQRGRTDDPWRKRTGTGSVGAESRPRQILSWSSVAPPRPRFPSNRWRSPNPTHRSGSHRRRQLQRSFAPDGLSPSLCDPPTARQCRTCLTSDIQGFTSFKRLMVHLVNAMHWPSISKLRHLCMFSGCSLSSLRKASSQQSSSGGSVEQNQSKFNWSLRSDLRNLLLG